MGKKRNGQRETLILQETTVGQSWFSSCVVRMSFGRSWHDFPGQTCPVSPRTCRSCEQTEDSARRRAPMATTTPPEERKPDVDYRTAEGLDDKTWREWMMAGEGLVAVFVVIAIALAVVAIARSGSSSEPATIIKHEATPTAAAKPAGAPTLADAKGVKFTPFERVDPTLPQVPPGAVKKFTVDVLQDKVQVAKDLAPMEAWTYTVNGKAYRGTAASAPIVVNQGDKIEMTFVNGGSKAMNVNMPHSIDFHSAEVAPSKYYKTIAPGEKLTIPFVAKHPGVFMYHCATQPILQHTSA